jgi:hypothetical protein
MKEHVLWQCQQEGHMVVFGLLILIEACRISVMTTVIIGETRNVGNDTVHCCSLMNMLEIYG